MDIIKFIKYIYRIPLMIQYGYLLESHKFQKLELFCKNKLKKNENDFIALFYLMYSKSYQHAFEEARYYFLKMNKIETLSKKTKTYYLDNIIRDLISKKKYKQTKIDCEILLKNENDIELKKNLLRVLCECNYYLKDFEKVLALCSLLKENYQEKEISEFIIAYINAVEKEKK